MATYDALSWEFNRIFNVLIPKHTTNVPEFNFHIQSVPCPLRQKIIACEKDLKITRRQPGKSHLHTNLYIKIHVRFPGSNKMVRRFGKERINEISVM